MTIFERFFTIWGGPGLGELELFAGVRKFVNKSAVSAASLGYVKFQAVIKLAASAASLRGGRASGRLDHGYFFAISSAAKKSQILKDKLSFWLLYIGIPSIGTSALLPSPNVILDQACKEASP